eukprot:5542396-Alexandrium_andersonii.AAC.1
MRRPVGRRVLLEVGVTRNVVRMVKLVLGHTRASGARRGRGLHCLLRGPRSGPCQQGAGRADKGVLQAVDPNNAPH